MNAETAESLLRLYRQGRPNDSRLQKAVRFAEGEPALRQKLRDQETFDDQITGAIRDIQPPDDLRQKLRGAGGQPLAPRPVLRKHIFNPTVVTAIVGLLLIVGFLVWTAMERMERFPGRDAVERMLAATNKMSGVELDPVTATAGTLGDWFYMRGFEGYHLPRELAGLPAVGSRVFRQEGHPVAQVAVDRQASILYVFHPSDFGLELTEQAPWRLIEYDAWVAALSRRGDVCYMLAFRGTQQDMRQYLAALTP